MKGKEDKLKKEKKKYQINNQKNIINKQTNDKSYNIHFTILNDIKKLKITLDIYNKDNSITNYSNSFSLNDLISSNKLFAQFKDNIQAFEYLVHNYTKIDESKMTYMNNNKKLNIILLFSINVDNTIYEEGIELSLFNNHTKNNSINIKSNKQVINFASIISNLKTSLEKFDLSIKELKANIDKDKIEKEQKINTLENNINIKLNKIKNDKVINDLRLRIEGIEKREINYSKKEKDKTEDYIYKETFNQIFLKLDEFSKEISKLKANIKERNERKGSKDILFNDMRNSNISNDNMNKMNEIIYKINNLEEKIKEGEEKTKKEIMNKSYTSEFVPKSIKTKKINDSFIIKNMDNIIKEKINEIINNNMQIFEEKLQIINNKVINLERNQNKAYDKNKNEESFFKDTSFLFNDSIIYDKFDKKLQVVNNSMNNKLKKLASKLNINVKDIELEGNNNNNNSNNNINNIKDIEEKTNDITNNDIKELNIKLMNEISNKIKILNGEIDYKIRNILENKTYEIINTNIQEIKQELFSLLNKMNERGKDEYKDLNNKVIGLKNELIKSIDSKNTILDNKMKIVESRANLILKDNQTNLEKMNYIDIKIKNIDNKIKQIENINNINNSNANPNNLNHSYVIPNSRTSFNSNNNTISSNEDIDLNSHKNTSFVSTNSKEKVLDMDSNIIRREDKIDNSFLYFKIKEVSPYIRNIKFSLIYRASRDGDTSKIFHSKCDFIGPNITLVKTKKGYIFGGFTTKSWKHLFKDIRKDDPEYGTEIKDEKAFGFSINEKKIYKNGKPNESAIFCHNNYGPGFKNYFFKTYNEFFKNGGICGKNEESNFIGQEKEYEINGGEEKFEIEEIELFQIGFK